MPFQVEKICCRFCNYRFRLTTPENILEAHSEYHHSNSNYCMERKMAWVRARRERKTSKIAKLLRDRGPSFKYEIKHLLKMKIPDDAQIFDSEVMKLKNPKPRFMIFYLEGQENRAWWRIGKRFDIQGRNKTFIRRTLGLYRKEPLLIVER